MSSGLLGRPRIGIIVAVWFFQFSNYFDRVAISFAGPLIMKSLHMDPAAFGVVLSAFGLGYFLAQVPGGLLSDRYGAKPILILGPLFWALFTGATGLVSGLAGFIIVRICFGISEGIAGGPLFRIFGDHFNSRQRATAIAISGTALPLGPAVVGPLIGLLLTSLGWRRVFFILMAPALLSAALNLLLLPRREILSKPATNNDPNERSALRSIVGNRGLWIISLAQFSFNSAYWGYLGWMPSYLALEHHIDLKSVGVLGGIPYVFGLFGMLLGGWWGSGILYRFRPQLLASFQLLAGLSLLLAYQGTSLSITIVGLCCGAFFLFGSLGPVAAIVLDLAPERHRGAFAGFVTTVGFSSGVVSPIVVGFLVRETGTFAAGFGFMITALAGAAACFLAIARELSSRGGPSNAYL